MQVYMRKGRLLLSLQAVKHALKLAGAGHPDVHRLIVRLCQAVQQQQQQASTDQVKRSMQRFVVIKSQDNKKCLGFVCLSCSPFARCSFRGLSRRTATACNFWQHC